MLTMLLRTSVERCVQRGIEADYVVVAPHGMIKTLVKAGLLPRKAFVDRVPDPIDRTIRCALFGVMPLDLMKRSDDIRDFVDDNERLFELKEGDQVLRHLSVMIARAGTHSPELYESDAAAQLMFIAVGNEQVFRALTCGNMSVFGAMLKGLSGEA